MGRSLALAGLAVIAIDGPGHGDRGPAPMPPRVYQQLIVDEGIEKFTGRMTADWLDAVSALASQGLADAARVSVFGMSMGARFGLFDALGSTDKQLIARQGAHGQTHPDDEAFWQGFISGKTPGTHMP
jgi:dienelactone hydrolase